MSLTLEISRMPRRHTQNGILRMCGCAEPGTPCEFDSCDLALFTFLTACGTLLGWSQPIRRPSGLLLFFSMSFTHFSSSGAAIELQLASHHRIAGLETIQISPENPGLYALQFLSLCMIWPSELNVLLVLPIGLGADSCIFHLTQCNQP